MSVTIPLDFTFLSISDEAASYVKAFFTLCMEKFARGEKKYGYLRGDTPFRTIYEHLLCEFGELILAMDGEDFEKSLATIREAITQRLGKPDRCPKCGAGSDDIGQLDEGLPLDDEEYMAAGGRYYCVGCGWTQDEKDVSNELADVTNLPVLVYVCGRVQGEL